MTLYNKSSFLLIKGRLPSLQRTKRELYELFVRKHITFSGDGDQITYKFLKEELPPDAVDRPKHTFLVVLSNNPALQKNEAVKAFQTRLDNVISRTIRNNACNIKMPLQKKLHVKPKTCRNIKEEHIKIKKKIKKKIEKEERFINLSTYFLCPVTMNELGGNLYLLNFSPNNETKPCQYSKDGSFYVGAGEIKNETRNDAETGWFIVNHLEKSMLTGELHNCD